MMPGTVVEQKSFGISEITYSYDGLGRRITEGTAHLYYSTAWQVLEERNSSNQATHQNVWSPVYVDALILRDRDTDTNGSLDERLYVLHDANWNVTALVNTSGTVVQRFMYDAYGVRAALTAGFGWSIDAYAFRYGHQGGRHDAVTGRINFRNRDYDPEMMRWIQQDPAGYVDGLNLYQYVGGNPVNFTDPSGLFAPIPLPTYHIRVWRWLFGPAAPPAVPPLTPRPNIVWTGKSGKIVEITAAGGCTPTETQFWDAVHQVSAMYDDDSHSALGAILLIRDSGTDNELLAALDHYFHARATTGSSNVPGIMLHVMLAANVVYTGMKACGIPVSQDSKYPPSDPSWLQWMAGNYGAADGVLHPEE